MEMNLRYILPVVVLLTVLQIRISEAQVRGEIRGKLADARTREAVEFAAVALRTLKDSTVEATTVTGKDGAFKLTQVPHGRYDLLISFVGYAPVKKAVTIESGRLSLDLGTILFEPGIRLSQVTIEGEAVPVTVKKDTVEFNAGSFKTLPNASAEDLLKKLPGIEVDKDGNIQAQGQKVNKVLVDGKEFFGNDPKAATKNLPADAIKKVQLIDDKTESSKNTGIDDGQREKVLNLTIKEDKKKGWFGNAALAGGTSERYLGQFNMNHFRKDMQLSVLFLSNNVNQSGFSYEDLNNFSGGNIFDAFSNGTGSISINMSRNGSTDINGMFAGVGSGGLINTHSGGINFSNTFGSRKQLKVNASYMAVLSSNVISRISDIQDPLNNELLYTHQSSAGDNTSNTHRLNLNFDYKADSLTRFQIKPNFSLSERKTLNSQDFSSVNQGASEVNSGFQHFDQQALNPSFGGQLSVNRRFRENKGSLNLFITGNYNRSDIDYTNRSLTRYMADGQSQQTAFDQQTEQDGERRYIDGSVSFVRQIHKARRLSMTIRNNYQHTSENAGQLTLEYNPVSGRYETLVPDFTNDFDSRNWRNTSTVGLSKGGDKLTYNVNAAVSYLGLAGGINGPGQNAMTERNAWAFVPNANLNYRQKNGRSLYLRIGSDVNMPSVTNLQPVLNNTNPLYIRQGNPDLEMSRSVSGNFGYNRFDMKTNNYINVYGFFTRTSNGFSTSSIVDPDSRIQTVRPVNVDGNYNANLGINSGRPTRVRDLRVRYGVNGSLSRNINFINSLRNDVDRISGGFNGGISYSKDRVTVGLDNNTQFNDVTNSVQRLSDQQYVSFNNYLNISVEPFKSFRIFADVSQTIYKGTSSSTLNNNICLFNAGLEKFFMKNRQLSLAVTGFDLLNQNSNIQRSIAETGRIEDFRTNNLNRYVYLKLNYKLQRVGGETPQTPGIRILR